MSEDNASDLGLPLSRLSLSPLGENTVFGVLGELTDKGVIGEEQISGVPGLIAICWAPIPQFHGSMDASLTEGLNPTFSLSTQNPFILFGDKNISEFDIFKAVVIPSKSKQKFRGKTRRNASWDCK